MSLTKTHKTISMLVAVLCLFLLSHGFTNPVFAQREARTERRLPPPSPYVTAEIKRRGGTVTEESVVRKIIADSQYTEAQNLLPRRRAISFQPFERVNPRTGRALNPSAVMTLPNRRQVTVQQFFDDLDRVEQDLNARGYSLRDESGFDTVYADTGKIAVPSNIVLTNGSNALALSALSFFSTKNTSLVAETWPYVSGDVYPDKAKEFTTSSNGAFRFFLKSEGTAKYFKWQVATQPFAPLTSSQDSNAVNPPGLVGQGATQCDPKDCVFPIRISDYGGVATATPKVFFVRAIPVSSGGTVIGQASNQVVVKYATVPQPELVIEYINAVQPSGPQQYEKGVDADFKIFLVREGFNLQMGYRGGQVIGFNGNGKYSLAGRVFNPAHLINPNAPRTLQFDILGFDYKARAGVDVSSPTAFNQKNQAQPELNFNLLFAGQSKPILDKKASTGNTTFNCGNTMQSFNPEAQARFWLGPIPGRVFVGARIDVGVACEGEIIGGDNNMRLRGKIEPFADATVYGGASVDAVIAYATLQADVTLANDKVALDINFAPGQTPVFQGNNYLTNSMKGRMYFKAGFYHPCSPAKQVKKIWNAIVGDEDMPLCETKVEKTLLSSEGFSDTSKLF